MNKEQKDSLSDFLLDEETPEMKKKREKTLHCDNELVEHALNRRLIMEDGRQLLND